MAKPPRILTLTTDFGADGPYVAALKGVVLGLVPDAVLVDVSHRIAPQNVLEGAFVLASIIDAFPPETVHLAVIDPGVGTERALVALRVADQWIVAPDNGLPAAALLRNHSQGIWEINNPDLHRRHVSNTFHGRDILAPAAAHLLNGNAPDHLGPPRQKLVRLANFEPRLTDQGVIGEVIFRYRFVNLITNIRESNLENAPRAEWSFEVAGAKVRGLARTYGDRAHGELIALIGSGGWVEIAIVNGDAAGQLVVGPGTTVRAHPGPH